MPIASHHQQIRPSPLTGRKEGIAHVSAVRGPCLRLAGDTVAGECGGDCRTAFRGLRSRLRIDLEEHHFVCALQQWQGVEYRADGFPPIRRANGDALRDW